MSAQEDFAAAFRAGLKSLLEAFATHIVARVPGIAWRVELPPSRVYDLVAVLTFMDVANRQIELVTVSLEVSDLNGGIWSLDVTDRESVPLDLDAEPLTASSGIDVSSVDSTMRDIDGTLEMWTERLLSELQP